MYVKEATQEISSTGLRNVAINTRKPETLQRQDNYLWLF